MLGKNLIKEALLKKESEDRIGDIQITKDALEKAHTYAKKIREVHGSDLECYFFLISPISKKDRIVRDIYFPDQEVTHAAVRITEDEIVNSGEILKKSGYKILGWAHSHASFHTFHSSTDDENHIAVLNEISSDNYMEINNEKNMFGLPDTQIEKDKIIISDKNKGVSLLLDISGSFKGKVLASRLQAPIRVGFAYSLVVNADENLKPHCEVAIKEFCPLYLREKEVETYKIPIKVILSDDYKATIDIDKILDEIKNKVSGTSYLGFGYREKKSSYQDLPVDGDYVYTKDEVAELLFLQKKELEKASRNKIVRILKEILAASAFGGMWRVIKRWIKQESIEPLKPQKEFKTKKSTGKSRDNRLKE